MGTNRGYGGDKLHIYTYIYEYIYTYMKDASHICRGYGGDKQGRSHLGDLVCLQSQDERIKLWMRDQLLLWSTSEVSLQHIVAHCSTLQHTATHCNTLHHTATHCNTLLRTATHCSTLQHTEAHCNNTLQHTATYEVFLWMQTSYTQHLKP